MPNDVTVVTRPRRCGRKKNPFERSLTMRIAPTCLIWLTVCVPSAVVAGDPFSLDASKIEVASGAKGTLNKDEAVFKVSYPRSDVKVTVDGLAMPPFMGLTSWASFMSGKKTEAMVMGDMVLFQDEVNPAMSIALENGLAVTALHNHFFYDEPK